MSDFPNFPKLASIRVTQHLAAAGVPLPEKTIRNLVQRGDIPAVWTGRKYLLLWSNIVDFLRVGNVPRPQGNKHSDSGTGTVRRISE